jgi:glycosyltransferase involved in cell wall biosynthesis
VRILLDYRPALRQRTGVGEYVHELAQALARETTETDEITLFSASWKDRLAPGVVPGAAVLDRKIPGVLLNLGWHRMEWPPVELLTRARFDVVQSLHPLLIPSSRAARLVTIHDLDFLDHPERTRAEIRRDYPKLAESHARRADHVVVNSESTAADVMRRFGLAPDRITVCAPGAPPWTPRASEPADGCILFLGTLEPRKNLGVLLDAYERLRALVPDAPRLVLAGGHGAESAALIARARQGSLAGMVDLPGYIPPDQREALYRRALVFIMPSHTEGFGMPVLEAMTLGVPVIVANRGALPEVAAEAGQYFEPHDAEALAETLRAVVTHAGLRAAMRDRGLARARLYDWRASAGHLRDAWARALAHRASSPDPRAHV